jgi:hypothetical protein
MQQQSKVDLVARTGIASFDQAISTALDIGYPVRLHIGTDGSHIVDFDFESDLAVHLQGLSPGWVAIIEEGPRA